MFRLGKLVVTRSWAGGGTLGEWLRPQESVSDHHDVREPGEQLQQIRLGVPAEECGEELACDGPLAQHGRAADVPQRHDGGEQTGLLELGHTVSQEPSGDQDQEDPGHFEEHAKVYALPSCVDGVTQHHGPRYTERRAESNLQGLRSTRDPEKEEHGLYPLTQGHYEDQRDQRETATLRHGAVDTPANTLRYIARLSPHPEDHVRQEPDGNPHRRTLESFPQKGNERTEHRDLASSFANTPYK